jgi:hypothetical protein
VPGVRNSEIQELRDSGIAEFRNYGIGKLENGKNKRRNGSMGKFNTEKSVGQIP